LHSRTHGVINCKLHPLNKEEEDRVRQFIKEEQREGTSTLKQHLPKKSKLSRAAEKPICSSYEATKQCLAKTQDYLWIKKYPNLMETGDVKNTRTTREDQCKVTTGTYTPLMMRPKSMGALLHFQKN